MMSKNSATNAFDLAGRRELPSRWLVIWLLLVSGVAMGWWPSCLLAQTPAEAPQTTFDPFDSRHDRFFPAEMRQWQGAAEPLAKGLRSAEALRSQLLAVDAAGKRRLELICETVEKFQAATEDDLSARRSIANFQVSSRRLLNQLLGYEAVTSDSFTAFDGRWFGRWGNDAVNHDWQPSEHFSPPRTFAPAKSSVLALQYAWISNGFGWNYLVSPAANADREATGEQPYILGMVYYFAGQDFQNIRGEKPHVGFADGPTRLVWITEREVFLEEVFPQADPAKTTYAITAIYHDLLSDTPTVTGRATQAIYTRDPSNRPAFYEFTW
ncbi:hypothetical protein SH139x_005481 [Planctomycetaceae bacterium SH139]